MAAGRSPDSQKGDYWTHLKSWWTRREDTDVLFLAFEHMKYDLPGAIGSVARFMNIALDDELLAIATEHASLEFMHRHIDRFDDRLMRERSVMVAHLPGDSDSAKVGSGQVGRARQKFSPDVIAALDEIWHEQITKELGFQNYEAMIAALAPDQSATAEQPAP